MNCVFPDAQPYDTYFLTAFAGLLVWIKKKDMFSSIDSIVNVIPQRRLQ